MAIDGGRAVVTARVAGRPRRLATEKQWRAAIAGGELKPDHLVEYAAPDCSPDTRAAGDVPELQSLFAELLPGFADWRRSPQPVTDVPDDTADDATPEKPAHSLERAAPVVVAAAPETARKLVPKAAKPVPGDVKPSLPAGSALSEPDQRDQEKSSWPMLIGGGIIALLVLAYALSGDGGDEVDPSEQMAGNTVSAEPFTPVPIETEPQPEPEALQPTPTPDAREAALRERRRLQREARATPTPTPMPTIVAPPPPPPVVSRARAVEPRDMERWARRIGSDYPSRALQREEQGTVGFRVTVGTNGRVEACEVTSSSGSSDLDRAACQGMRRFARFDPALNDAGEPIVSTWSSSLAYRLE